MRRVGWTICAVLFVAGYALLYMATHKPPAWLKGDDAVLLDADELQSPLIAPRAPELRFDDGLTYDEPTNQRSDQ